MTEHESSRGMNGWGLLPILGVEIGLAVGGVFLPSHWKLFGIYPAILGMLFGIAVRRHGGARLSSGFALGFVLLAGGGGIWVGQHGIQYQRYVSAQRAMFASDPTAGWGLENATQRSESESEEQKRARADFQKELDRIQRVREEKVTFTGYLQTRGVPLGMGTAGLAWGLFLGEMVLCCLGGCLGWWWNPFREDEKHTTAGKSPRP